MGSRPSIIRPVERFIVGTGRCGSTLLSRMLAECPAAASLCEVLNGLDFARRFQREPMTGPEFAAFVTAEQPVLTATLRRGYPVEEVVYPFERGRFRRGEPMPYLAGACLPRLTEDPDALLDALLAFARALPPAPPAEQYRLLFAWLAERHGRRVWIERSGSSIEYLPALAEAFPGARFLHLHRDGRETALSMREHHAYRVPISLLYQAPVEGGRPATDFGPIDFSAAPRPGDPISRILAARPPAEFFGRYWSDQLVRGLPAAGQLPPGRWLALRFEELLEKPEDAVRRAAEFFELPLGPWLARASALVRGGPPARFPSLAPEEARRLAAACRPGEALLREAP
jgi:sulfotransferase family protein